MKTSLSAFAPPENFVSRDRFGSSVPRRPAHLHVQAESGAYIRYSSRLPRRLPFFILTAIRHRVSPEFIRSRNWVPTAFTAEGVRRHMAGKPQGSSERGLPWQVTMDQLMCSSLSHTHYWYRVGMLKVPARCSVLVVKIMP